MGEYVLFVTVGNHIMLRVSLALLFNSLVVPSAARFGAADEWPQWRGVERDGVWREARVIERRPRKGECRA